MRSHWLAGAAALAFAGATLAAGKTTDLERQVARLNAVHDIQNLMTRYAQDNWSEQFDDLMQYIALDMPDVHINVPNPLVGAEAVRGAMVAGFKHHGLASDDWISTIEPYGARVVKA